MIQPAIRLAIFASGNGTNAEAIMEYFKEHSAVSVALIVSNKADAYVLKRALKYKIPSEVINKTQMNDPEYMALMLGRHSITHIVLAGFLLLIPSHLVTAYPSKIINIHPALLPKYGGKGMYGNRVHQAVKDAGEPVTGITIHLVNNEYDQGKILFQETTSIIDTDEVEGIAAKVHVLEHQHYPKVIEQWALA